MRALFGKTTPHLRKIILNHLWQMKGQLLLAGLCMLGFTLMELMTPWPIKILFDHIISEKSTSPDATGVLSFFSQRKDLALLIISFSIFFIALLRGSFSYFRLYLTGRIGHHLVYALRSALFKHLQRVSLSFHNTIKSGELLTKVTGDTKILRNVFTDSVLRSISHLLSVTGMMAIMLFMNWRLSLIILVTLPVIFWALARLQGKIKASSRNRRNAEGRIASRLNEMLASVPMIRAFGREEHETERFEAESFQTLEESLQTGRFGAAATRTVEVISATGLALVIYFGSTLVLQSEITPGELLVFTAYLANLHKPLRSLARLLAKFSKASASAERIEDLLRQTPEAEDAPQAIVPGVLKGAITFEDVSFAYGDGKPTLNDISFSVAPGERLALVGGSGAGKSTITNLLLRLYDASGGTIYVDGTDIQAYRREPFRHQIGIVLQEAMLFGTSIRENIAYGKPDATMEEIATAAQQAHAASFIEALPEGYETKIGERGATLSGGQRQRIALARALIKRPAILILDEPTSAIDAESEKLIWQAIENLDYPATLIVIAHHFAPFKTFDQILVLKNGEIVEAGNYHELVEKKGDYYQLLSLQAS